MAPSAPPRTSTRKAGRSTPRRRPRPPRGQLELARNRLAYTVLRASRSGVVTATRAESGQVVAEGQPVVSIANPGEPEVVVDVPEDQVASFKTARYRASLAAAPGETFDVALRELAPQAAAQTRTYRARLKPVTPRPLPLGATATLVAQRAAGEAAVAPIPAAAITQSKGRPAVWVVRRAGPEPVGTVELAEVAVHGYGQRRSARLRPAGRRARGHRRGAEDGARHGGSQVLRRRRSRGEAGRATKSFNLTEWALGHRAVVLFLLLMIGIGGVLGFGKLGQLEDPNFSVPSMTAMVIWPGATAQQVQDELLNRMEKRVTSAGDDHSVSSSEYVDADNLARDPASCWPLESNVRLTLPVIGNTYPACSRCHPCASIQLSTDPWVVFELSLTVPPKSAITEPVVLLSGSVI